jgi:hypothetical protein
MSVNVQPEEAKLRAHLLELIQRCPLKQCKTMDCLLFPVMRMSPRQRVRYLNTLSLETLRFLAFYHYLCFGRKTEPLATPD